MVSLASLWLPILLSAVAVFVASSIVHMVLPHHRSDYNKVPSEDALMDALRAANLAPGDYLVPHPGSPAHMRSEEYKTKVNRGPVAMLTVMTGFFAMGKRFAQWFAYILVVGGITAYVARYSLPFGSGPRGVFRIVGLVAFAAYGMCEMPERLRSPKKKRAMSPPTRPPAAGSSTRIHGSSDSAPRRMSLEPTRRLVNRCVRERKMIAPAPPSRPATAARIRNWVLGSRQKKRPNREGRAGGSGELILHLQTCAPRIRRPRLRRRRRRRASTRPRRTCCLPCGPRTPRRPASCRSGTGAGRRETPARRFRSGPRGPTPHQYKARGLDLSGLVGGSRPCYHPAPLAV